jgi:RNA recognition motif-containing protein
MARHDRHQVTTSFALPSRGRTHGNIPGPLGQDILLSNVPPKLTDQQLFELLSRFGNVQLSRGLGATASARFRDAANATAAVSRLNGLNFHGNTLIVTVLGDQDNASVGIPTAHERRADSTTSSQLSRGPLVVNGAKSARPRYRGRRSSVDSDSSDDDSDQSSSESDNNSGFSGSLNGGVRVR